MKEKTKVRKSILHRSEHKVEVEALDRVGDFLRLKGWNPILAEFYCIEKDGENYSLVIKFIGHPPTTNKER